VLVGVADGFAVGALVGAGVADGALVGTACDELEPPPQLERKRAARVSATDTIRCMALNIVRS
jgi:hypothetical protein